MHSILTIIPLCELFAGEGDSEHYTVREQLLYGEKGTCEAFVLAHFPSRYYSLVDRAKEQSQLAGQAQALSVGNEVRLQHRLGDYSFPFKASLFSSAQRGRKQSGWPWEWGICKQSVKTDKTGLCICRRREE